MRTICLRYASGQKFQVSDEDYDLVSVKVWYLSAHNGSVYTSVGGKAITFACFVLGKASIGLQWDHEDRDKLNCQRSNLRQVTQSVNQHNTGLRITNKSGVKGVYYDRGWRAKICIGRISIRSSSFNNKDDAIKARKEMEARYL